MITNEIRIAALNKASPQVELLYGSVETARLIKTLRIKYGIQNDRFVDLVGDTLLELVPRTDFTKHLTEDLGITPELAARISVDLEGLFDHTGTALPISIPEAKNELREKLELRPEGVSLDEEKHARPLTRDEVLRALAPARTMASDIASMRQKATEAVPPVKKD